MHWKLIGIFCLLILHSHDILVCTAAEEQIRLGKERSTPLDDEEEVPFIIPVPTFGGLQVWTDHSYQQGYRIQHNTVTDHWRLIDSSNRRWTWGTREHCEVLLQKQIKRSPPESDSQHCVVLIHGLMRTRNSMIPLRDVLRKKCDREVVCFSYASSRATIGQHAEALREFLESFPSTQTFSFVGHSMGNIVIRRLIADLQVDLENHELLERCKRMVMLGPPNQGSTIARCLSSFRLFEQIAGEGAMELGPKWEQFVKSLATPPFPFLIVAGETQPSGFQNPLLEGASDFVVEVDEARLEGSHSFVTVPVLHSFLMDDARVQDIVTQFLCH